MANLDFKNESSRKFTDISSEAERHYLYPEGFTLEIKDPQYLSVSDSGNHYVVDIKGRCYIITPGWRIISWQTKQDRPHFVA